MILKRYKAIAISGILIFILSVIGLLCFPLYSFLSPTVLPHTADVLIVEGWLADEAREEAKQEFLKKDYQLLITTGLARKDGYLIGSGGIVGFDLNGELPVATDNSYTITFRLHSTPVSGEYAHVKLFADSTELGSVYTSKRNTSFTYRYRNAHPPESISILFDNDEFTENEDRNLFVHSVEVNGRIFPANSNKVAFYLKTNGVYQIHHRMNTSNATEAADYFKTSGIPDTLVIPVETSEKIKSKTYTTALDVKNWLDLNRKGRYKSLTVFTQGPHARRSYISFRKAFGDAAEVGVIALPEKEFNENNWYKTKEGWKTILYESVGVMYALLVL